jgi:hypothetical protein
MIIYKSREKTKMKLEWYEIKGYPADTWEKVKGTTVGMREGWLAWKDGESEGLARPGTWRKVESKTKVEKKGEK